MSDVVNLTDGVLNIDLTGLGVDGNDLTFKSPPAGTYALRLTNIEQKVSRADRPYFKVTAEVIEGDHTGAKATDNLNLIGADPAKTKQQLSITTGKLARILEKDPTDFVVDGSFTMPLDELLGAVFQAKCAPETFQGYTSFKIKSIVRAGGKDAPATPQWGTAADADDEIAFSLPTSNSLTTNKAKSVMTMLLAFCI